MRIKENTPSKCSHLGRLSDDVSGSKAAFLKVGSTLFLLLKIIALEYICLKRGYWRDLKCCNIIKTRKHADSAGI
jgi:hypothetical protein